MLRYGVGPAQPRSEKQAAELLAVSRGRVRLLEQRGLRSLTRSGRGSSCEQTDISLTSLVAVYDLLSGTAKASAEGLPVPLAAGVRLANAATGALDDEVGSVAGARQSAEKPHQTSSEPEEQEGPVSSAGPSLGNPFGAANPALDNPMFLVLLAIVVACLASAAREIRRAVR